MRGPFISMEAHLFENLTISFTRPARSIFSHYSYEVRFESVSKEECLALRNIGCDAGSGIVYSDVDIEMVFRVTTTHSFDRFIDQLIKYSLGEPHILLGLMLDRSME